MGAFFIVKKNRMTSSIDLSSGRNVYKKAGFKNVHSLEIKDFYIDLYPSIENDIFQYEKLPNGFIYLIGVFCYDGKIGIDAVQQYFKVYKDNYHQKLDKVIGSFCLLKQEGDDFLILRDAIASFEVFYNQDKDIISSLFLSVVETSSKLTIKTPEIFEFVFYGNHFGGETIFHEIKKLNYGEYLEFRNTLNIKRYETYFPEVKHSSLDSLLSENADHLVSRIKLLSSYTDQKFRMPLSGGFDSRLVLACCLKNDIIPDLYTYEYEDGIDAHIAKEITESMGLPLTVIKKSEFYKKKVSQYTKAQSIEAIYYNSDGIPYGGIFGECNELFAKQDRVRDNYFVMGGAGGEIYRNFFNLLSRQFSMQEIVNIFYEMIPFNAISGQHYQKYLKGHYEKLNSIHHQSGKLSRNFADIFYMLYRCRNAHGKELSNNMRYGFYDYPIYNTQVMQLASQVPAHYRYNGLFEAQLIQKISPELASFQSEYNFSFDKPIPTKMRTINTINCHWPTSLRPYKYKIRNMLDSKSKIDFSQYKDFLDLSLPYVNKYFNIKNIKDADTYDRLFTLEYICQKYNVIFESSP